MTVLHTTAALLTALLLSGCAGTMITRSSRQIEGVEPGSHDMFGGYPFQAVVVDWRIEARSDGEGNSTVVLGSLAIDIVVDLVLAPIDLIAWPFGCHKRSLRKNPYDN